MKAHQLANLLTGLPADLEITYWGYGDCSCPITGIQPDGQLCSEEDCPSSVFAKFDYCIECGFNCKAEYQVRRGHDLVWVSARGLDDWRRENPNHHQWPEQTRWVPGKEEW